MCVWWYERRNIENIEGNRIGDATLFTSARILGIIRLWLDVEKEQRIVTR